MTDTDHTSTEAQAPEAVVETQPVVTSAILNSVNACRQRSGLPFLTLDQATALVKSHPDFSESFDVEAYLVTDNFGWDVVSAPSDDAGPVDSQPQS